MWAPLGIGMESNRNERVEDAPTKFGKEFRVGLLLVKESEVRGKTKIK